MRGAALGENNGAQAPRRRATGSWARWRARAAWPRPRLGIDRRHAAAAPPGRPAGGAAMLPWGAHAVAGL